MKKILIILCFLCTFVTGCQISTTNRENNVTFFFNALSHGNVGEIQNLVMNQDSIMKLCDDMNQFKDSFRTIHYGEEWDYERRSFIARTFHDIIQDYHINEVTYKNNKKIISVVGKRVEYEKFIPEILKKEHPIIKNFYTQENVLHERYTKKQITQENYLEAIKKLYNENSQKYFETLSEIFDTLPAKDFEIKFIQKKKKNDWVINQIKAKWPDAHLLPTQNSRDQKHRYKVDASKTMRSNTKLKKGRLENSDKNIKESNKNPLSFIDYHVINEANEEMDEYNTLPFTKSLQLQMEMIESIHSHVLITVMDQTGKKIDEQEFFLDNNKHPIIYKQVQNITPDIQALYVVLQWHSANTIEPFGYFFVWPK